MANGRNQANHIEVIEDDGQCFERANEKSEYFYNKFKERFAPENPTSPTIGDWSDIFNDRTFLDSESYKSLYNRGDQIGNLPIGRR